MKNIVWGSNEPGTILWRLSAAFDEDPLMMMLSIPVRKGIAKAFYNASVEDGKITLTPREGVITWIMDDVLNRAPLGWVGNGFKKHVASVAVAALLPEGDM